MRSVLLERQYAMALGILGIHLCPFLPSPGNLIPRSRRKRKVAFQVSGSLQRLLICESCICRSPLSRLPHATGISVLKWCPDTPTIWKPLLENTACSPRARSPFDPACSPQGALAGVLNALRLQSWWSHAQPNRMNQNAWSVCVLSLREWQSGSGVQQNCTRKRAAPKWQRHASDGTTTKRGSFVHL